MPSIVDKFVVVTRHGYSEGVAEKARKLDVELLTLDEARDRDWSELGPSKLNFSFPPHICQIRFDATIDVADPKELSYQGRLICPSGHDHGSPMVAAQCLVFHRLFPSRPDVVSAIEKKLRDSPDGQAWLTITAPYAGYRLKYKDKEYPLNAMIVVVHAVRATGDMMRRAFQLDSSKGDTQSVQHFEAIAGGKKFQFIVPGGKFPPDKIVLRVDSAKVDPSAQHGNDSAEQSDATENPAENRRENS
jgi:hypothetical protein